MRFKAKGREKDRRSGIRQRVKAESKSGGKDRKQKRTELREKKKVRIERKSNRVIS